MNAWIWLLIAIVSEVIATSSIRKGLACTSTVTRRANGSHGNDASRRRDHVNTPVATKGGVKQVTVWMEHDRQRCAKV